MIRQFRTALLLLTTIICLGVIFAVCWHSLDEIHYLKSFFPDRFSVQEAFYASGVELVKVIIISLPLALIIYLCLRLFDIFRNKDRDNG
jgi:hypothetical protein